MLKKWIFYSCLLAIIGFLSYGFKPFKNENKNRILTNTNQSLEYLFPSLEPQNYTLATIPFRGKFFIGFREAIGNQESRGQYTLVNTLGYMGKYQFGSSALKSIGITNFSNFLNNPKLQEKAFIALLQKNKWLLKEEIKDYSGKIISGVRITESGILAAAHLGGAGSVKLFLQSHGRRRCKDNYGASIKSYMKSFGGYETSGIVADSSASVL